MTGIPLNLAAWAQRWSVPQLALDELRALSDPLIATETRGQRGEAWAQSAVRLEAAQRGVRLWRNNNGAFKDPATDRWVRFGLANDSARLNEVLKSSDLVGWRPVTIEQRHVGYVIAQTVTREVKPEGWSYSGTDREKAQWAWINLVNSEGGDAAFATGPGTL